MHYTAAPSQAWAVRRRLAPEYLLTQGPYRVTRNPMYVGGLAIWSGWTILLGSPAVAGTLVLLVGVMRRGVEFEERSLAQHHGEEWRAYAARTPRWLRQYCCEELAIRYGNDFGLETDMPVRSQIPRLAEATAWSRSGATRFEEAAWYFGGYGT